MSHDDAPLGHDGHQIPVAQPVADVPTDALFDDFSWKATPTVDRVANRGFGHGDLHKRKVRLAGLTANAPEPSNPRPRHHQRRTRFNGLINSTTCRGASVAVCPTERDRASPSHAKVTGRISTRGAKTFFGPSGGAGLRAGAQNTVRCARIGASRYRSLDPWSSITA